MLATRIPVMLRTWKLSSCDQPHDLKGVKKYLFRVVRRISIGPL